MLYYITKLVILLTCLHLKFVEIVVFSYRTGYHTRIAPMQHSWIIIEYKM